MLLLGRGLPGESGSIGWPMTSLRIFVALELALSLGFFIPGFFGILPFIWCAVGFLGCYTFVGLLLFITAMLGDCGPSFIRTLTLWAPAIWLDKPEWMGAR